MRLLILFKGPGKISHYTIFGRKNCIYCERAKFLLDSRFIPYEYLDIEEDPKALEEFKALFIGAKSVPQIYDDQLYLIVGGYDQLVTWIKEKDDNGK